MASTLKTLKRKYRASQRVIRGDIAPQRIKRAQRVLRGGFSPSDALTGVARQQFRDAGRAFRGGGASGAVNRLRSPELITRVVLLVERAVKQETPVRTGHLRRSFTHRVLSNTKGVVGTNLSYARAVHNGRRAVTIRPRNGKALFWKGATHPVKVVHQKARAGNPFITRAADRVQPQVEREIATFGQSVLNDFGKEAQAKFRKR